MNEVTTNGNIQLCYGIEQAIRYATIPLWIMRMYRYKISTSSLSKRTSIKIKNPHSIGKKVSGYLTPDTFFHVLRLPERLFSRNETMFSYFETIISPFCSTFAA